MNETCKRLKITLHLSHLKSSIFILMNRLKSSNKSKFDENFIYPTNHDAVLTITNGNYGQSESEMPKNITNKIQLQQMSSTLENVVIEPSSNNESINVTKL